MAEKVIERILSDQVLFVFGEFLSMPNIRSISADNKAKKTLELFAFGTYPEFKQAQTNFLPLNEKQAKKLKMISIAEFASRDKKLLYSQLQSDLDISSLRELEDLIIDCFYNDLLRGKLDQKNQCLEVHMTYCRDAKDSEIDAIIAGLEGWDE